MGYLFSGLSAGSILILVALGLSIIFGVMGVINMAQGELVMVGAYATYITQLVFQKYLPESAYNWYFVMSIPVSFIVAALVGMLIEATVVRRLYGRPLDTLLATFGVGLILTQAVRATFGDNIGVKAPSWLQGGWEIVPDITLPYARIFAIGFCVACIVLMYVIVSKTKLGLLLRATTQNRAMAGALGVPTRRVDLYTFALGAGLAGMAGCALTPIEGVTPNMGNNYVIDSFLVVVSGGVGKLAGAIWAGAGLGMINKLLEPIFQTVWAKVIILALVVLFLQWRPSGLFPAKGRLADV
jgi:urea transport system permease protein